MTATKKSNALSLEDQFAFYASHSGSYHTNKINVLIHIVCVPLIFQTALVLLHAFPHPALLSFALPLPAALGFGTSTLVDLTPPFLLAVGYAAYFILLEPVAGALYAPVLLTFGHLSNVFYDTNPDAIKYAGIAFAAAWVFQFIGHGKFEGRAPALFDSLLQSLVLALFFVFLEVLFTLGYRPTLHKRVQNRIGKAVLEYRQSIARGQKGSGKAPTGGRIGVALD